MVTLTFSPSVMLALIGSGLILLVLVAFFPGKGDNILQFCSTLVDLYQRLRQILQQMSREAEVKTQQREAPAQPDQRIDNEAVLKCDISDVSQGPSAPPLAVTLPQQEQHVLEARGE